MTRLGVREHHRFEAAGKPYLYLVPSAAIVGLDPAADMVMQVLGPGAKTRTELLALAEGIYTDQEMDEAVGELLTMRAIGPLEAPQPMPKILPLTPVPLGTMVLNVTNQCNLACTYCYEYGEDKIVDTENGAQPKFMSIETAKASVDFMLKEAGEAKSAHLTFFGGETLLNFNVLKETIPYARQRAAELGKDVDFSLTTNATLLKPDVIKYLVENQVGVTISFDGPPEVQNKFRVFHNGTGSYDIVAPKIKELLQKHRNRPVGARVTLTGGNLDVSTIYKHLTEEFGFREVGFAPVTTSSKREYALDEQGYDTMLTQFTALAEEFKEAAIEGRHHGFSNVKETIQEIHQGMSKAYPCGAGIGLMGVSTSGDVALCHRFAGSDDHKLGTVRDGIDRSVQAAFLDTHHLANKTDCSTCWARPVCSGGCYHEAHTRYGDTTKANLHYCDWIRSWTDVCLRVYAEIAEKNPAWLAQFDREPMAEKVGSPEENMRHLKTLNQKAARIEQYVKEQEAIAAEGEDVVALQRGGGVPQSAPNIPLGCAVIFSPGWEVDRTGGTAGLCQPVERDLFDCHIGCYWPAQVPDQLNHAPDWTNKCAAAQKDWRKIDLIFP